MKRIVCIFLMTMAILPATMFAQTDVWDGSAAQWTQGSGTESDPYLIETAENLAWIAEMVNNGVTTYEGVYFKLVSDLDMNSIAWVPIGNSTTRLFRGKFDGHHHFIDNLSITGSYDYTGLFGITGNGFRCRNLGVTTTASSTGIYCGGIVGYINGSNTVVENCYHTGSVSSTSTSTGTSSGGIVGYINATTNIANCYNTGTVSSRYASGGIVSYINATTNITNCYNFGAVSTSDTASNAASNSYSGGIVGIIRGSSGSNSIVENCYNTGTVTAISNSSSYSSSAYSFSGGIVGRIRVTNTIVENCYNTGTVLATTYNRNGYAGYSYSGGMVGRTEAPTTITKCYNKSSITSTTHCNSYSVASSYINAYSGGLVGISQDIITLNNSYNRGTVHANGHCGSSSNTVLGTRQAGGLIGLIDNVSSAIENCYNTGILNGATLGGIRGNTTGSVSNCYYLETCGGTVSGGTSKTEAAMKSTSFPVLLNTDSTVFVMDVTPNVNDGYPIFGSDIIAITTKAATNLNFTSATLNGIYETQPSWPGGEADVVGFEYKEASATNYTTVYTNVGTPAAYNLPGLQSGTNYQYRLFVQKDGVTYYGNVVNFSTLQCNVTANVQASSASICAGDTDTLTATATSTLSDTFTYLWSTQDTTASITATTAGTYTVTVTDGNGCTATANTTITVNPLPVGTISGNTALCAGESTTLTASGANRYNWNTGASAPTITVSEGGTYVCTFTNSYNCSSTQSVEVSMFSSPVITGETAFCAGGSTTLTATGGTSYTWSTGATTPTITVSQPGTYSVTGSSVGGCTGSSSVTVVENPLPTVEISGYPVICSGIGAELTATEGSSYLWSTGEATRSITANHTGNFSVLVTDANGCSNTTSVEVIALSGVSISGNTNICQGESTTLSVETEGNYLWSTGAQTELITVSDAGYYSVTVSLPNGCSASANANVSINPQPVSTISGNTTICQGETTTLVATGGTAYQWSAMGQGNSITVTEAGTYTVTATNAQGCSATASTYVTVNPLPNITISGNTALCQGNTTTLVANGATTYQWSNGVSGAVNTIGTFGIYTVTGISAEGCSNTASATVVVYQLPVLNISGDTQLCSGETTTLTANGAATYLWNNGTTDAALTTGAAGTYTVIGTDEHGCYSTASIDVAVNYPSSTEVTVVECDSYEWQGLTRTESGDYTWTGHTAAGCDSIITLHLTINESVTTEVSETASNSYEWHGTTYTESGDYTWTGQTANGCDSTVTLHLTITTGVNEWGDGHFTLYPNPTTGMVNVQFIMNNVQLKDVDIQIFDVYGRLLNTVETCHGASLQTTQIDLSSYAPGIYLIKLVGDGRVIGVRKVVKR